MFEILAMLEIFEVLTLLSSSRPPSALSDAPPSVPRELGAAI